MKNTLIFEQIIPDDEIVGCGETTRVEFTVEEGLNADDFFDYLIRFALAAGYQMENIENCIVGMAHAIESMELEGKYDSQHTEYASDLLDKLGVADEKQTV